MNYKKPLNESTGYPKYFVGLDPDNFEDMMNLLFFKINNEEELKKIKNFSDGLFLVADEEVTNKDDFAVFASYDDIIVIPMDDEAQLEEYSFKGGTYQMRAFDKAYVKDHSLTWNDIQEEYGKFFGDED